MLKDVRRTSYGLYDERTSYVLRRRKVKAITNHANLLDNIYKITPVKREQYGKSVYSTRK